MILNTLAVFVAFGLSGTLGAFCSNEGSRRCAEPNGKSARFFECVNGKEKESICASGETCHGNGHTGTMCINVAAFKKRQELNKRDSAFGGYEPLLNSFNNGMYGDAKSFGGFVTNMRSMMFTDKNALGDVTSSISSGISANKNKIASNTQDIGKLMQSDKGKQSVIDTSKKFSNSLNQNKADYAYLVADIGTNTKNNPGNRSGLSDMMTNTFTTSASGATGSSAISGSETSKALSNLNFALNTYYPATLGKIFTGSLSPSGAANDVASLSSGNSNGTESIYRSLLANTKDGTQYVAPFTAAAVQLTDQTGQYATPARLTNVLTKYRSASPSSSSTVNILNGAANAAMNSKGKFRSSIDNSYIAYTQTVDGPACGCASSDSYASMMAIAASLSMSQMMVPSGSCCYPSGGNAFAARALLV